MGERLIAKDSPQNPDQELHRRYRAIVGALSSLRWAQQGSCIVGEYKYTSPSAILYIYKDNTYSNSLRRLFLLVPEQILLPTALATRCSSSRFRTRKAAVTFDLPCATFLSYTPSELQSVTIIRANSKIIPVENSSSKYQSSLTRSRLLNPSSQSRKGRTARGRTILTCWIAGSQTV